MAEELTLEQKRVIAIANARARVEEQKRAQAEAEAENAKLYEKQEKWKTSGPVGRAAMTMSELGPTAVEMVKSIGLVGGGTAVGQLAGQRVAGKPGAVVGGAVAGALSELANQGIQVSNDPNAQFAPGQIYAAAVQGAFPARGTTANVVSGAAAEIVRSMVDEQRFPELRNLSQAGAMGYVAGRVSQAVSGKTLTPHDALYEMRKDAFARLRKYGAVVNPMELRLGESPGFIATVGGSSALGSDAIHRNQYVLQSVVRGEIGLSEKPLPFRRTHIGPSGAVVKGDLDTMIEKASAPYKEIRSIAENAAEELKAFHAGTAKTFSLAGKSADELDAVLSANNTLDALKVARTEIKDAAFAMKSGEEGALARFKAAKELESTLEGKLDLAAQVAGKPDLVNRLKESRVKLSRIFAVRDSVIEETGIFDPQALGLIQATATRPGHKLTGRLADVADFATAFGRNAADAINAPLSGATGSAVNYMARQTAQAKAGGPLAAGVPYVGDAARKYLLSEGVQNKIAMPSYQLSPDTLASAGARNFLQTGGREPRPVPFK